MVITSVLRAFAFVLRSWRPLAIGAAIALCLLVPLGMFWERALGNVPIRFYGRVVDSDGRGLVGVAVHARVTAMPFFSVPQIPYQNQKTTNLSTITDNDGRFAFKSEGLLLEVVDIQSAGWALWNAGGGMEKGFRYSQFHSVPAPLHDKPSRAYVYRMVPAASSEAKWNPARKYRPEEGTEGQSSPKGQESFRQYHVNEKRAGGPTP